MKGIRIRLVTWWIGVLLVGLWVTTPAVAALKAGDKAPVFNLTDMNGVEHSLDTAKEREMMVLYFFDSGSRSNQEGLLMLDSLLKRFKNSRLTVWGITRSPQSQARSFAKAAVLSFPILLDEQKVSRLYGVGPVLPVVCTLGPNLTVLDYFQGGGKSAEIALVRLAERQLNRDQPQLAQALGAAVAQKDPDNAQALAVQGYAALKQGKVNEAEQVFNKIAAKPGKDALVGKEGQAAVKIQQGQVQQAMALVDDVTKNDPQRAYAHKLKGDLLAEQGDTRGAQKAYEQAVRQPVAVPFQKAEANNQLGRVYAYQGNYDQARKYYDQAITLDPYYLEPTSNKGVTYEREGMWSKALAEYRRTLRLDQNDTVAAVLARKAEQMMSLQKDTGRQERIRQLVKDLTERYQKMGSQKTDGSEDTWTSRPMVLTFVDMKESGGLSSRDGLAMALSVRLGELLGKSGRVKVVDRALLEHLMTELNLGSSELADPSTALRLGRILAAKLIGTGNLMYLPDSTMLNLRLIDTETSAVAKTINLRMEWDHSLDGEIYKLNRDILQTVMEKYPLRGFVVEAESGEVMLNLGSNQGVISGSAFDVVEGGETITYKGRVLQRQAKSVARLEVVRVEPDLCFAKVVQQQRPPARDDKVKEVLDETMIRGSN